MFYRFLVLSGSLRHSQSSGPFRNMVFCGTDPFAFLKGSEGVSPVKGSVPQNQMFFRFLILSGSLWHSHSSVPIPNLLFCGTDPFP